MHKDRGFTLIELMIVIAVVAILLMIAVPAWSHARATAYSSAAKAALAGSVLDAVRHAANAGTEVVVCPSANGAACADTVDWTGGWLAYADIDGDRTHDALETTVRQQRQLAGGVRLRSTNGRKQLVFQPSGGNAGSNVTFTLCDSRGWAEATTLVLSNSGNLRQGKPTAAAAQACAAAR